MQLENLINISRLELTLKRIDNALNHTKAVNDHAAQNGSASSAKALVDALHYTLRRWPKFRLSAAHDVAAGCCPNGRMCYTCKRAKNELFEILIKP